MPIFESRLDRSAPAYARNRAAALGALQQLRDLQARTLDRSAQARARFAARGQLLPRERVARLLDAGAPFVEFSTLAGYGLDDPDPQRSVPGGGCISGIGYVAGVRALVLASDSGIDAGAIQPMGLDKMLRAQAIALANKLPFIHLVESAGANLLRYRVETFLRGGGIFFNLARLSAAGIPVITVVHGASTAGGAYMPGLSDYVVMVRGRAQAFLAGPALLKAATGEEATEEELGGAQMHASVSGLAEYVAEDDAHALGIVREIVGKLGWGAPPALDGAAPRYDPDELLGVMPADYRTPVDMREAIARIVDESDFLDFKPDYGAGTVVGHARIQGHAVGILTNNAPLDPAGAAKATHFIQACCQSGHALVFLQNTTGYLVGRAAEEAGMIKHGAKMIQAVANANVPKLSVICGASFGAGNYGMCGIAYEPRFAFCWPSARIAVMGAEQAATTMAIVAEAAARRRGVAIDEAAAARQREAILATFERQSSAFAVSALMMDDGVIDPRDTRNALGFTLSVATEAERRVLRPVQFGVARP